ncbi:MAG: methyltransferase domain-containing protein [Alphaproteobacteria bacterium]|nr:methyltransferase domain-containing protein [Alphaproteobacteria bacterium]
MASTTTLGRLAYSAQAYARVAWYAGHHILARRLGGPTAFEHRDVKLENKWPKREQILRAMQELFETDWANVEAGIYAPPDALERGPFDVLARSAAFLRDVPSVARRRRDRGHDEVLSEEARSKFPRYYLQNFHYQSGGWLSEESARIYDFQVETLFSGTADAMRRQALVPIAAHLKGKDQRRLNLLDVACGTGRFLSVVKTNWPKLKATALDLSPNYIDAARETLRPWRDVAFLEANAEAIPLPEASQDIVTAVFLFHELPPKVRADVVREIARVLKPGGIFVLLDSIQEGDLPGFEALTELFPQAFHEPYYESYLSWDVDAECASAGLSCVSSAPAYLSKVLTFAKA